MKITARQKHILLEFVEGNEDIAKNKLHANFTANDAQAFWKEVTLKLNACRGPKKTWKSWRKSWQDIKCFTKAKAAAYFREGRKAGDGQPSITEPTSYQKRVIALIGSDAFSGHEDVVESHSTIDVKPQEHIPPVSMTSGTQPTLEPVPTTSASSISNTLTASCIPTPKKNRSPHPERRIKERDQAIMAMQQQMLDIKKEKLNIIKMKMEAEEKYRERNLQLKERKLIELKRIGDYLAKIKKNY